MKNRIRTYLTHLAPVLAAEMLSFLSNGHQGIASKPGECTHPKSWLVQLIARLAETVETEDYRELEKHVGEFASTCAEQGMSLLFAVERLRVCRDKVLEYLNRDSDTLVLTTEDRVVYYQIQLQLYQVVDRVVAFLLEKEKADPEQKEGAIQPNAQGDLFSEVAEQELVQLVLQSSDIAVLMIDRHLKIIEANYALARLFRVDREKILGTNIDESFCPHESERFVQWVIERGQSGHYVAEYNSQWTTVSTSPIYHAGEVWGAIAVLRNLTDSKRYEEELTKREALAAVGQLAAGMAHEIRNPLTSIKGFIQLLREQGEPNRSESYFSVILTEIERIDGLLNDVLVLARYRDDKIVTEHFPVMEEIYGVIRLLEPEANRRGIKLEQQIADGDWYIMGYRSRIKQAFLNILKNAFEALVNRGSLVSITVFASIHQLVITVEDDGEGLSRDTLQNLFVPFFTTKQEGTGLGLSTTQRIINDHGGEIFADNSPRLGGARFEIRLPLTT
ncbi:two-component system sensor histidine kinase NtrB [Brevibacillus choshinensis]|uniref:histidine kinase n=1 Tax=Brevibacillus choshinensis TaxID=54911 RepID=A0ABX7FGM6_BRECH|nr:ATP-binding protein [Brevibacillus choshinensis]QRG65297.1 PAS domain S-box protein [Brevibacillus choshinensis]